MKLLYATKNKSKIYNMKNRLKRYSNIQLVTPNDLSLDIEVNEDGTTARENAIKKAKAYYQETRLPTIAADTALYITKLPKEKQPGLFVKRVFGKDEENEETLLKHYQSLLDTVGGSSEAYYLTGVAYIDGDGLQTIEIKEDPFILTSTINTKIPHKGNFLDIMTIDPALNKYYTELTDDELLSVGGVFEKEIIEFIKRFVLKINNK